MLFKLTVVTLFNQLARTHNSFVKDKYIQSCEWTRNLLSNNNRNLSKKVIFLSIVSLGSSLFFGAVLYIPENIYG